LKVSYTIILLLFLSKLLIDYVNKVVYNGIKKLNRIKLIAVDIEIMFQFNNKLHGFIWLSSLIHQKYRSQRIFNVFKFNVFLIIFL